MQLTHDSSRTCGRYYRVRQIDYLQDRANLLAIVPLRRARHTVGIFNDSM